MVPAESLNKIDLMHVPLPSQHSMMLYRYTPIASGVDDVSLDAAYAQPQNNSSSSTLIGSTSSPPPNVSALIDTRRTHKAVHQPRAQRTSFRRNRVWPAQTCSQLAKSVTRTGKAKSNAGYIPCPARVTDSLPLRRATPVPSPITHGSKNAFDACEMIPTPRCYVA